MDCIVCSSPSNTQSASTQLVIPPFTHWWRGLPCEIRTKNIQAPMAQGSNRRSSDWRTTRSTSTALTQHHKPLRSVAKQKKTLAQTISGPPIPTRIEYRESITRYFILRNIPSPPWLPLCSRCRVQQQQKPFLPVGFSLWFLTLPPCLWLGHNWWFYFFKHLKYAPRPLRSEGLFYYLLLLAPMKIVKVAWLQFTGSTYFGCIPLTLQKIHNSTFSRRKDRRNKRFPFNPLKHVRSRF